MEEAWNQLGAPLRQREQEVAALVTDLAFELARHIVGVEVKTNADGLRALVTQVVGLAWVGGLVGLLGMKINFFNFVALPITFGIGVDYAVNIVERYLREGAGGVARPAQ